MNLEFEPNLNIGSRNVQIQALKKTDPSTLIRLGIGAIYVLGPEGRDRRMRRMSSNNYHPIKRQLQNHLKIEK